MEDQNSLFYDKDNDIFRDCIVQKLGQYIKEQLNERLPIEYKRQGWKVVNSLYLIDMPQIPLTDYPVLKVFRLTSTSNRNRTTSNSLIRISYSISYASISHLPNYINWVRKQLDEILLEWSQRLDNPMYSKLTFLDDRYEFNTSISSLNSQVFNFLNVLINLLD